MKSQIKVGIKNQRVRFLVFVLSIVLILVGLLKIPNKDTLKYAFAGYSFMGIGEMEKADDVFFVFDNGRKNIVVFNEDMRGEELLFGGGVNAPFFYGTHADSIDEKNWYISDIIYGDEGTKIVKERIQKVDASSIVNGCEWTSVYEWDYSDESNPPKQNGYVAGIKAGEDGVTVMLKHGKTLELGFISSDGVYSEEYTKTFDEQIYNAVLNDEGNLISVNTFDGKAYVVEPSTGMITSIIFENEKALPISTVFLKDELYIAECVGREILCADISDLKEGKIEAKPFYNDGNIYMEITADEETGNLYFTDQVAVYMMHPDGTIEIIEKVVTRYFSQYLMFALISFPIVIASAAIIVISIIRFAKSFDIKVSNGKLFTYIMIALATIVVGTVISLSLLGDLNDKSKDTILTEMNVLAGIIIDDIDGDYVKSINEPDSYSTPEYAKFKRELDRVIDACYSVGSYYYYTLFAPNEERDCIYGLMDYEGANASWLPAYPYDDSEYAYVLETGEMVENRGEISAYGSYIYVDKPIFDSNGEPIAVFELGMDADRMNRDMNNNIKEMLFNVFIVSCVVVMLFIELMFAYDYFVVRKSGGKEALIYAGVSVPIRFVVFLSYMAMGLQDAFIVLYSARLYDGAAGWLSGFISAGIGAALPLSIQTLTSASASLFGGTIVEKFGTKRMLVISFILQVGGYVVCAMDFGYAGILLGMFLVGAGAGFTYVSCNTMVSLADNSESVEKGYADVSAGVLSGCTVGVGMGSFVLSISSVSVVYVSAAVFSAVGLIICLQAKNRTSQKTTREKVNFFRFFANRTVFSYFLFLLVPYMICIAFKDYFFPTYVAPMGIDEVEIGRINLLIGLPMLYIGPSLATHTIGKLKEKGSIISASILIVVGMVTFALFPSVSTAIIGLVLFYISSAYAFTCQYNYFGQLSAVSEFGEGNAMGVYSMFENLGQTIGPIFFGAMLALGFSKGILLIGIVLSIFTVLFAISGLNRKQKGER